MHRTMHRLTTFVFVLALASSALAQEQSVRPGINDSFRDPDAREFAGRFEVESREVFARRQQIVKACRIQPGQTVADIGAGTGLFTRLFAEAVGTKGRVIAVDISQNFLGHIRRTSSEAKLMNVETVLCKDDSTELPADSVDLAFICDTYHHFEFPHKTMASLHRAMKPGGRVILIDFHRIEGSSSDWIMNHVRAGQDVFEAEIEQAGFQKTRHEPDLLKENYFVEFTKKASPAADSPARDDRRSETRSGRGRGRGMGQGMGRGPRPDLRADQEVFHYLLSHRDEIRRTVGRLDNGVETLTESDDPAVADKIQEHVAAMHARIKEGRGFRYWDELFVAIFERHAQIRMTVENTRQGVRVVETSADPRAVALIQAHAEVVSRFVEHGFNEAHKNHPVSPVGKTAPNGTSPLIEGHGRIIHRPTAVELPRAGAKVVFDITAGAAPDEVNPGLERAARLLNLYGAADLKVDDVAIVIVLHGDATHAALNDEAHQSRLASHPNPNLALLRQLQEAGVQTLVCGQALNYKKIDDGEVADGVQIAVSALSAVINKQAEGYSYVPVP